MLQIVEQARVDVLSNLTDNNGKNISEEDLRKILKTYFDEQEVESLEIPEDVSTSTSVLTTKKGNYKIKLSDIYDGRINVKNLEPGLYDLATGTLKKSWDTLIEEDVIKEENGVVSAGSNSDKVNILSGQIVFPNDITEIADGAFNGYTGLSGDLIIPSSVIRIGHGAFALCTNLTGRIVIPNSVKTLGNSCFARCGSSNGLESLEIDVTIIPNNIQAFYETKASNLVIGNNCTTIGDGAFEGCINLTGNLIIPSSVTIIGRGAFQVTGFTGTLTIPDSVTKIGQSAFNRCKFTGNLTIGNSVTEIGGSAFGFCSGFTGVLTLPDSVSRIEDQAFYNCTGFDRIIVPDTTSLIGTNAFYMVEDVYYNGSAAAPYGAGWGAKKINGTEVN